VSGYVQERYKPVQIGVNSTTISTSSGLGGFLCVAAGSIAITTNNTVPKTIIPTLAVSAGVYYPFPFVGSIEGLIITTTGGASGVLAVD
jgi:ABC-type transporter lipoprotein component MlaA